MSMYYGAKNVIGSNFLYLHSDIWYDPRIIQKALKQTNNITFMVDQKTCEEEEMKLFYHPMFLESVTLDHCALSTLRAARQRVFPRRKFH